MVYAMMSIGILGFIVWSFLLMASPSREAGNIFNFAVCWNSLMLISTLHGENLISYTQSADNLSLYSLKDNKQSVSETIRETFLNFSAFRIYYNTLFKNTDHLSDEWLTWFIGFAEGDGAIQTYDKGKRVRFVLTQKESDILHKIQFKLNIGVVKHFPQGKSGKNNDFYRWIVDNPLHILLLAFLFNGNLAQNHRIEQLALWVNALNNRFGSETIKLKNTPVSITLQDAWLSGFTDAEGCFNVSITVNSRYTLGHVIKMRYLLDQKDSVILNKVYELFGFGSIRLKKSKKPGKLSITPRLISDNKKIEPSSSGGRLYSSQPLLQMKLDPFFLTGFTDAEGSFMINVRKSPNSKFGWSVKLIFQIELHKKDKDLLNLIKSYFQEVGNINKVRDCLSFRVSSVADIVNVILPHFDSYPLNTIKSADYFLFREVALMMKEKQHLSKEGWARVLALKASSNKGFSEELKVAFPDIIPADRSPVQVEKINPNWLSGFVSGDGGFHVNIFNSRTNNLGSGVKLIFKLTQHIKDEKLLRSLISYFGCGGYYRVNPEVGDLLVSNFSDLKNKIIPLFKEYPILGIKSQDFQDFCKVAELMEQKKHLTKEGLLKIKEIKAGMNKGRTISENNLLLPPKDDDGDDDDDGGSGKSSSGEKSATSQKAVTLRSGTDNVYRYTATGFKPLKDVIAYFKLFPLQTKKALSFEKWLTIHNQVSNKLHLTEEGLSHVRTLQKQINLNNSMTNKTGKA